MSVRTKLAAFTIVLAVTFGVAFAVGGTVGPIDDAPGSGDNQHSPLQHEGP